MSGPRYQSRISSPRQPSYRAAALLAAAAAALLLAGCGERGDVGIFASIEREEKIEKSNLPEVSTAGSMVYDPGTDTYYVALGQLYARDRSSNEWDEVDHPGGYGDGHTLDIVLVDADADGTIGAAPDGIYVAFFDTLDSEDAKLFRLDPSNNSFGSPVWNPGKEIARLITFDTNADGLDDEFLGVTVESDEYNYNLVYSPGNIGGGQRTIVSDSASILDGDYNPNTGASVFITRNGLYEVPDLTSTSLDAPDGDNLNDLQLIRDYSGGAIGDNSDILSGVTLDAANGHFYVSSRDGVIFRQEGAAAWSESSRDDDRRYTDVEYVDLPGFTGAVVGMETLETSSGGYYEVDASLGTSRPDGDNYNAADISDAAIHGFYVDTANDTLFALTNGTGLWSATYDTDEPEWRWE